MREKLQLLSARAMWQEYLYNGPTGSCQYSLYTPASYPVRTAVPLLVMLHGCAQIAGNLAAGTHMNQLAEKYNFIDILKLKL